MIQECYRQMRKFGCTILAVVLQYGVLKTSEVRGAMIGNSKMFLKLKSPSAFHFKIRAYGITAVTTLPLFFVQLLPSALLLACLPTSPLLPTFLVTVPLAYVRKRCTGGNELGIGGVG